MTELIFLIVTSFSETFGMVVLEAMSRGLVVIASNYLKLKNISNMEKMDICKTGDFESAIEYLKNVSMMI